MAAKHGNFCALNAAGFTRVAHQRAPAVRWLIIALLAVGWAVFGVAVGVMQATPVSDSVYATLQLLTMSGGFEDAGKQGDIAREIARFAGIALTAIGLLFGFSGAVGRAFARLWMMGARDHVVIAGESAPALALARSCRAVKDGVVLIARGLETETAWFLRQSGIILIEGDPTHADVLRAARAAHAAHFVALSDEDTENLRIEAALRALLKPVRRRKPLAAHVSIGAPLLLMEAREMRMLAERERSAKADKKGKPAVAPIDPRSFSLEEISARALIVNHAVEILDLAARQSRPNLHFVLFGFDETAEAVAVRTLMSFWSASFGPPRITVFTPDGAHAESVFAARYPQARAHAVWKADIEFRTFDWGRAPVTAELLETLSAQRGEPAAVIVSTGADGPNIQLALALMRTANARGIWAAPIFLRETMESDFSREFASGDKTVEIDAYLQAFGAVECVATRSYIVDGMLDRGAAIAHRLYEENMQHRDVEMRHLETVGRTWDGVPETYRNANRAVVDSALVKLWDAGWTPAPPKSREGDVHPHMEPDTIMRLAEVEHDRWMAERLLSGWRPGPRNNRLMVHNNITPWSALTEEEKSRDADQVRGAAKAARVLFPRGFVRRT